MQDEPKISLTARDLRRFIANFNRYLEQNGPAFVRSIETRLGTLEDNQILFQERQEQLRENMDDVLSALNGNGDGRQEGMKHQVKVLTEKMATIERLAWVLVTTTVGILVTLLTKLFGVDVP